ncbi:VCBS repeat-containing protein [Streptomyces sp. NPDC005407]|uniref:FG-GAP repeat domain-containing protein n=1 Tax=Streptomyces sp. NPDC005407 TaxID=3155340 RepID=UPI0033A40E47
MRGAVAATISLSLAAGLGPMSAPAAADAPPETVIPVTMQAMPRHAYVMSAGDTGFLHMSTATGYYGLDWTDFNGATRRVEGGKGLGPRRSSWYGAGSDIVALPPEFEHGDVRLQSMATGEKWTVNVPRGMRYSGTFGDTVLAENAAGTQLHLLRSVNGAVEDRTVTGLPEGSVIQLYRMGGTAGLMVDFSVGDGPWQDAWVDFRTASASVLPPAAATMESLITARHVVTETSSGVRVYEQGRFDGPVHELTLNMKEAVVLGVVGDSLILGRYDPQFPRESETAMYRLYAVPFDGSPERLLMNRAVSRIVAVRADGGLVMIGGASAQDYGFNLLSAAPDGAVQSRRLLRIPPVPMAHRGMVLSGGSLTTVEYESRKTLAFTREISPEADGYGERKQRGSLSFPYQSCGDPGGGLSCPELFAAGDGRIVYRGTVAQGDESVARLYVVDKDGAFPGTPYETGFEAADAFTDGSRIVDVSGHLVLFLGRRPGGGSELHVVDIDSGKVLHKEDALDGALWGTTLWTSTAPGTVTAKDARTGAALTSFTVGTGCGTVYRLKAVGRWLYWKCSGGAATETQAGVFDVQERRGVSLPVDTGQQARLGDGFVVTGGNAAAVVHDIQRGTGVSQTLSPASGSVSVDPHTGQVAYSVHGGDIHISRRATQVCPLAALYGLVSPRAETDSTPLAWRGEWWLSKPAGSWSVVVRHKESGRTVANREGGVAEHSIATSWEGRDASGGYLPNGTYTWTLTAQPADGHGPAMTKTGDLRLTGGQPIRRDHAGTSSAPDGAGDLLTLDAAGAFAFQHGTGAGTFSGRTAASGWVSTATAVLFGDINGDRCNDVLVRLASGELRAYKPACGAPLVPSGAYTKVGLGWGQYDVLTSPGDITGDGSADLVARQASTGDMYLYAGAGDGKFAARVKFAANWKTYTKVIGVGDVTGDGRADLLAHDATDGLWRYDGLGDGRFKGRAQVFSGWGRGYNVLVGVGDITGDAKPDIVARDGSGNLYRHNGTGTGTFGAGVRIGTGWQSYKLF